MIRFIDRTTGNIQEEKVFGENALKCLYATGWGKWLNMFVSRNALWSNGYGLWQKMPWTKGNIAPFIKKYDIDPHEFLEPVEQFNSFNDFFIRKLKPEVRPIDKAPFVMPADARYFFFQDISKLNGIFIKGQMFSLKEMLNNEVLAEKYHNGSMAIARLCPTDYHRFHFPVDCIPGESQLINGFRYSVNPIALKQNIHIFSQNKRSICSLKTNQGEVLFIEVGATSVATIIQTYQPYTAVRKGDEKGYFSFGGSTLVLLFEPGQIRFDQDLVEASRQGLEIRCLMGQSMGT